MNLGAMRRRQNLRAFGFGAGQVHLKSDSKMPGRNNQVSPSGTTVRFRRHLCLPFSTCRTSGWHAFSLSTQI